MQRLLAWVVLAPVAVLVLLFAVANRGPVTLSLDPFDTAAPAVAVTVPLFLLLFGVLLLGVLVGGLAHWAGSGRRHRREARRARQEAERYRAEAERLREAARAGEVRLQGALLEARAEARGLPATVPF